MNTYAIVKKFIYSEQLNTTTAKAIARLKSLTVSVFPVPAGPAGAPPIIRFSAYVSVM